MYQYLSSLMVEEDDDSLLAPHLQIMSTHQYAEGQTQND